MLIEYKLESAGWAEVILHTSQGDVTIAASYLHDSLRELTEAALFLCKGASYAEVGFVDEPGEHQFIFNRIDTDILELTVARYIDWPTKRKVPDEVMLRTQTTVTELRKKVLDILWTIEKEYGPERYLEVWIKHDFPQTEYERLKTIWKE